MKAKLITYLNWVADARLFELSESVKFEDCHEDSTPKETNYVIVSAVVPYFTGMPEVLIFPARENGTPYHMLELAGLRGTLEHAKALELIGAEIE